MEHVTNPLQFILVIGGMTLITALCFIVYDARAPLAAMLRAAWERYVVAEHDAGNVVPDLIPDGVPPHGNNGNDDSGTKKIVVAYLTECDDDDLLMLLASVQSADDDYRFADSRIAKFVGGRIEDRVGQVRAMRGKPAPPRPNARMVNVRGADQVYAFDIDEE
jgi:hypothetical protein